MLTLSSRHVWFTGEERVDHIPHLSPLSCLDTARGIWTSRPEFMLKMRLRCDVSGCEWVALARADAP